MRRIPAAFIVSLVALAVSAPPAGAVAPERSDPVVFDANAGVVDEELSAYCGFRITARISGHYRETVFFNKDGSVRWITAHPSFRSTLSSKTATISTADVGLDRYVENDDGTISIFGTGIHLKLKDGPKAIGLWRLVYDPEADRLVSQEYSGRFDVTAEETADALCDALS